MSDFAKARRLNELRARFERGARLTVAGIADEFGVTRRTVNRDLLDVQDLGIDLECEELSDRTKVWSATRRSRMIDVRYSIMDIATVLLGRRLFDFLEGTLFEEHLNRVYHRIESQIARLEDKEHVRRLSRKLFMVHEGPKRLDERSVEVLDACLDALLREQTLNIDYVNAAGERSNRNVQPLTLVAYKRGLYLLAHCLRDEKVRVFGLERIAEASWRKGESFAYPRGFDPERFFANAMFIVPGEPERVVLEFTASSEPFIRIRRYHHSQTLEKQDDGSLRMTLDVPIGFEVVNWILSFGSNVLVVEPLRLKEMIRAELRDSLARYETRPAEESPRGSARAPSIR